MINYRRSYWHGVLGILLGVLIWRTGTALAGESAGMTADDLVYVSENFPPHNYMENGELKGISVDVLELIWKKLGAGKTRASVRILPWARAIKMLESSPNMVLFGMGYTRERAEKFHWVGPYFVHELSLITRADDPVSITQIDDARQFTIGVVRMDLGHQFLVEKFFDPKGLELCADIAQLHQKFIHHRFRVICCVSHAYFNYSEKQGMSRTAFKKAFTLSASQSGFGFSPKVPLPLVAQFRRALDQLRAEGILKKILSQYGME